MMDTIKVIIEDILTAIYEPFGFAVIMAILIMFFYMFAKEYGWKSVVKRWLESFKTDLSFRRSFFFVFYTTLLLFRTLLNRRLWEHALADVIGVWGIYNSKGEFTADAVENFALFIPFTILLLWCFQEKIQKQDVKLSTMLWKSVVVVFGFSISIEFLQLFLRLGMFQLSDMFHNTLGGFMGGLIYCGIYKMTHKNGKTS